MNSKIFRIVIITLIISGHGVIARGAESYDAIKNGGFEAVNGSGKVVIWHGDDWSGKGYKAKITVDKSLKIEGTQSVRITTDGIRPNLVIWQDVNVGGDTKCKFALMSRVAKGVSSKVELICYDRRGKNKKILKRISSDSLNLPDKWMPLSVNLKTPAATKVIRVILRATGMAWFDKITFQIDASQIEPSNTAQLKQKKAVNKTIDTVADLKRKAKMSPEELAWEKVLEENLGNYYLPVYKRHKSQGRTTAWDFVKDDPKLPRVLLIGDSISRAYTLHTRRRLAGKVNLHRAPANCGSTGTGLRKLDIWLGDGHWNLIYFNFGIHNRNSNPKIYARDLDKIIARLKKTGAKLVWAQSTPLSGTKYKAGSMVKLNAVAEKIMKTHNIPVSNLYRPAREVQGKYQTADGCHYADKGNKHISKFVAQDIMKNLQ